MEREREREKEREREWEREEKRERGEREREIEKGEETDTSTRTCIVSYVHSLYFFFLVHTYSDKKYVRTYFLLIFNIIFCKETTFKSI